MSFGAKILNLEFPDGNDADADTVRDYLKELLLNVWSEGEGFSGKRPFGNSGWENELYEVIAFHGYIKTEENGYIDKTEKDKARDLIFDAIWAL